MKRIGWIMAVGLAALAMCAGRLAAQPAFENAGFEDDGPEYNTGYNTFKWPVTNWSRVGDTGEAGVMYYGDDAFTTGTGYESQILGMRQTRGVSQTVGGFTVGVHYQLVWEGNSRETWSTLSVTAGVDNVWSEIVIRNSGAFLSYTSRPFTAASSDVVFTFRSASSADQTVLLDNLEIVSTTNRPGPFFDLLFTGDHAYGLAADAYSIDPFEPPWYLRMQFDRTATTTLRNLQDGRGYRVSLHVRNRGGFPPNDFRVDVDDVLMLGGDGYTVPGTAWTNLTFDFTAVGTTAEFRIESLNTDDSTVCFDAFRIQAHPPPRGTLYLIK